MEMTKETKETKKEPAKKEAAKGKTIKIKDSEYQKLQEELSEYKDKCVRLYAEFENTKKRMEREKSEFVKFANEGLITEFLGVMDDLERSVETAQKKHEDYDSFLKGIEMVMSRIHELLKKNDVKPIDCVGKQFNPHEQEALMQEKTDKHEDGEVIEELQKGYYLGDRVVRTAKVKVAINDSEQ